MESVMSSSGFLGMVGLVIIIVLIVLVLRLRSVFYRRWDAVPLSPVEQEPPLPSGDIKADAAFQEALARGNKIEAIKRVRELTGMGLKEAKDFVEQMPSRSVVAAASSAGPPSAKGFVEQMPSRSVVAAASSAGPPSGNPATDSLVRELLARGNKIEAIKRVRELTGMGLKEAKDFVEQMQGGTMPTIVPASNRQVPRAADVAQDRLVRELLAQGNKIEAIKRVRKLTGMGLKEAKDFVESL